MNELQKFCIENIYCAPSQDRQFFFSLVRINKENIPIRRIVNIYNVTKHLPNNDDSFHVFTLGNLYPEFINFLSQQRSWLKDTWLNFANEMTSRNIIIRIYNDKGEIYPSTLCYYNFTNENGLLIALKVNRLLNEKFNIKSMKYLHVYSNSYFNTSEFLSKPVKIGIDVLYSIPETNVDKVNIQNYITTNEAIGGKCLIFVNGYYREKMTLDIPNHSVVEVIYDQSIIDVKEKVISRLRTFDSEKDNRMKYFMFNEKQAEFIHYFDDNDYYITTSNQFNNEGVYFYRHKDFVIRNVTDKDYSLDSTYLNNQATYLSSLKGGYLGDKKVICIYRKPGLIRNLVYSDLKLHELYKLPYNKQLDVMLGTGYTLPDFRVEKLENSKYFELASSTLKDITKEKSLEVLGYNATTYYFANNVYEFINNNIQVPVAYRQYATAFEYDNDGKYLGCFSTTGPEYIKNIPNAKYVEFIYGIKPTNFGRLYNHNETFTLQHNEYRILSAYYDNVTRITNWEDITNNTSKVTINNNQVTLTESLGKKIKVVYFNQINVYDIQLNLNDGFLYFPLTIYEDRGLGYNYHFLDVPYLNLEIYLNGYKLTYGLDYFIKLPYVSICNKKYINYTNNLQNIHIRMYGFNLDENKINKLETRGFVNHGVLTRNNIYDVRDDRVFSVYIDGKLYKRENILYAEDDNTVRINHPLNGLPYTLKEPFIALKDITQLNTLSYFNDSCEKNERISNFFNIVFPEPNINETNVISDHHYLFSPTVSRIINHVISGVIPESVYQNFNDMTIHNLLNGNYKEVYIIDPVKYIEENNIVEIHPHLGNSVINVNIFQYRFIDRLCKIIAGNRINLSGYLSVT